MTIAIFTIFLLTIAALAFYFIRKRKPKKPNDKHMSMVATAVFNPEYQSKCDDGWPVMASEKFAPFHPFKPNSVRMTEHVSATYKAEGLPDIERTEVVEDAADIMLRSMWDETAEVTETLRFGLSGQEVNAKKDWPTLQPGLEFWSSFEVHKGVLMRARKDIPAGYNDVPSMMTVKIKMELVGQTR